MAFVQLAGTVALLYIGAVSVHSLRRVNAVDLGIDPTGVLVARLPPLEGRSALDQGDAGDAAHHDVEQALGAAALLQQRLGHDQVEVVGAGVHALQQPADRHRGGLRRHVRRDAHDDLVERGGERRPVELADGGGGRHVDLGGGRAQVDPLEARGACCSAPAPIDSIAITAPTPKIMPSNAEHGEQGAQLVSRLCAITGEKALLTLEAAYTNPVSLSGQHHIDNGLLFRAGVHKLFDRGCATVTPDYRFLVSRRAIAGRREGTGDDGSAHGL
jgi:hypothetical protein